MLFLLCKMFEMCRQVQFQGYTFNDAQLYFCLILAFEFHRTKICDPTSGNIKKVMSHFGLVFLIEKKIHICDMPYTCHICHKVLNDSNSLQKQKEYTLVTSFTNVLFVIMAMHSINL